jgi:hypothetical protein
MATYCNLYLKYCNENVIYVRLLWELRGFSPNFTLCDWFIYSQDRSTYFLHQNRQINLHCSIRLVASESESRNNFFQLILKLNFFLQVTNGI